MDLIHDTMFELADEMLGPNFDGFTGVAEEAVSPAFMAASAAKGSNSLGLDPSWGGFISESRSRKSTGRH
jgi:hypothetical protein